ncbi:pyruvate, phosphate dikinase [Cuniculiplasma sp. SKW4]|uniref:pyruvate, phosphate dikinase n=1 Tax=Cuniculiplasma sp. SKW4 TaxID=3400171 RepID=UPI003FD69FB6
MFEEGNKDMAGLLGGKGAGLAEMRRIGLSVPPGFTITTEACILFQKSGKFPEGMMDSVMEALSKVEEETGKKLGSDTKPLLVSVRSGAPISMPGMMDTILNVGLNDSTIKGLISSSKNKRFALDSYRRLKQMFGTVVMGIEHEKFEEEIKRIKERKGKKDDIELDESEMEEINRAFDHIYKEEGMEFPQDPMKQMTLAIEAVFNSWNSPRAKVYREINHIPETLGTAVNIVSMVFGNMGEDSATGVAFTRDPNTGEKVLFGEFLQNAQGEDVVAGIRTPRKISEMERILPEAYREFVKSAEILEKHYRDMQDMEFTIEKGKFYMLQTRSGKRSAKATVRIAVEMVEEGLISKEEAIMRVTPSTLDILFHPQVRKTGKEKILGRGLAASPGAAIGAIVFSSDRAVELAKERKKVILVRPETTADDVRGMSVSEGFLTQKGGMTSHAAVVARAMGKPAVVGVESMNVNVRERSLSIGDTILSEGDVITVDGTNGEFILGTTELEEAQSGTHIEQLLTWADQFRKIGVRANANTPEEAIMARKNGAEGIGLARTERMFLGGERIGIMRAMIMSKTLEDRKLFLSKLLPMQIHDFTEFFRTMEGFPVIIRLLDPPLHEFLPDKEEVLNSVHSMKLKLRNISDAKEMDEILSRISSETEMLETIRSLEEFNPMLGFRGCRLGIVFPEIYEMQVEAIIRASLNVMSEKKQIFPEIMIPLVGTDKELSILRERLEKVAINAMGHRKVDYKFGTMIEIPRACITADKIGKYADFFSFGTNDLTQMTFGYSRDDAEGKFMAKYLEEGVLPGDPFRTVDFEGVGELMKMAVEKGRKGNKSLEVGICGEQGGDPETVEFCHRIGLNYVSASPFRIPIARLAAARAALKDVKKE